MAGVLEGPLPPPIAMPVAPDPSSSSPLDRRTTLKAGAGLAALATAASASGLAAPARGSDTVRVGVIGCGGRGSGAAVNCVDSSEGVEIVAMGDLFEDRLQSSRQNLVNELGEAVKVTDDSAYVGWDAYEKVIARDDVDLVILATPPHFRPIHLEAAIAGGKHVFMEKPVAVDPAGIRKVIAAAKSAKEKGLGIVAGTQRRHQRSYIETIQRIHDGAIGEVVGGSCYWNMGSLWMKPRKDDWTDMEWQLRNWLYFTWLSGDHICEQHIHQHDVMNWVVGATPLRATGMGGREVRTDEAYGNIFDHHAVEYEYPGGVYVHSYCRQIQKNANRVDERVIGTNGFARPGGRLEGPNAWRYENQGDPSPYQQEHTDLIASIRAGEPLNEGIQVAHSTLTAIMGRMSTYSGQTVTWEQALNSELDLSPAAYEFGPIETRPVAVPGVTPVG